MHTLVQSQQLHVKMAFVSQFVLEVQTPHRSIDSYHIFVPVKLSKDFKKLVEKLDLIFELSLTISDPIIIEHIYDKGVETIRSHTR